MSVKLKENIYSALFFFSLLFIAGTDSSDLIFLIVSKAIGIIIMLVSAYKGKFLDNC